MLFLSALPGQAFSSLPPFLSKLCLLLQGPAQVFPLPGSLPGSHRQSSFLPDCTEDQHMTEDHASNQHLPSNIIITYPYSQFPKAPQSKLCVHHAQHLLKRGVGGFLGDQSRALCPMALAAHQLHQHARWGAATDGKGHAASAGLEGTSYTSHPGLLHIGSLTPQISHTSVNLRLPRLPFSCPLSSKPDPYDFLPHLWMLWLPKHSPLY